MGNAARSIDKPNIFSIGSGDLGARVMLPTQFPVAPFRYHVRDVVRLGPHEEMIVTNAGMVVAGMADLDVRSGELSMLQFVDEAVGEDNASSSVSSGTYPKNTVLGFLVAVAHPKPASVFGLLNVFPEALLCRLRSFRKGNAKLGCELAGLRAEAPLGLPVEFADALLWLRKRDPAEAADLLV